MELELRIPFATLLENPDSDQSLQLSLKARRRRSEELSKLGQVPGLFGPPEGGGQDPAPNAREKHRERGWLTQNA